MQQLSLRISDDFASTHPTPCTESSPYQSHAPACTRVGRVAPDGAARPVCESALRDRPRRPPRGFRARARKARARCRERSRKDRLRDLRRATSRAALERQLAFFATHQPDKILVRLWCLELHWRTRLTHSQRQAFRKLAMPIADLSADGDDVLVWQLARWSPTYDLLTDNARRFGLPLHEVIIQ